jgi:hypothetical protein
MGTLERTMTLYSSSELQGWTREELIEEIISLDDLVELLKGRCITGDYSELTPSYRQGIPEHELEDYATAAEINKLVNEKVHL